MSIYIDFKNGDEIVINGKIPLDIQIAEVAYIEDDEGFCELLFDKVELGEEYISKFNTLSEGGLEGVKLYANLLFDTNSHAIYKGNIYSLAQEKIAEKFNIDLDDVFLLKYINIDAVAFDMEKEYKLEEIRYLGEYYVVSDEKMEIKL